MTGPRILTIDIETSPNLAHVWGLWQQNVGLTQLLEVSEVICWGAKWHDEDRVMFRSNFHDGHDAMIAEAWELLDQADIAVTYNGLPFDIPHLNREFLLAGLDPYSEPQHVDLLKTVKKRFKFPSNKLAYVVQALGLPYKLETGGHELWVGCLLDDPSAWKLMKEYCCNDVVIEELLYDHVRPWIKGHPHMGLFLGEDFACQNCGGLLFKRNGWAYTKLSKFQRYKCKNCGVETRDKKAAQIVDFRAVA